jgi:hypothetical protein
VNAIRTDERAGATRVTEPDRRRARLKMLAILLVCAAPVVASYFAYYVIRPEGRTNYGELLLPLQSVEGLPASGPDGKPATLGQFRGKWVMLTVDSGACAQACEDKLYSMRQVRLTTGKDRDRVERVLLLTDDAALPARIAQEYEGMHVVRANADAVARLLPAAAQASVSDHIFIVDPLGNLVMRFPKAADPNRMKKDISKMLRASRVG